MDRRRHERPRAGTVDVWICRIPNRLDLSEVAPAVLDDGELDRARALAEPLQATRLLGAHVGLRAIVGAYLDMDPGQVELTRAPCPLCGQPHGRPSIESQPDLHVSMSHSRDLAVYALADRPVGIDVERYTGGELAFLAPYLHPAERMALRRVPAALQSDALMGCWVRKEAYLKGLGVGLAVEPASVDVGLPWRFDAISTKNRAALDGWDVSDLLLDGALAAFAVRAHHGDAPRARIRELDLSELTRELARQPLVRS